MRPIEFRGFSLSDKQWKYGYYYVNTLEMHNIVCPDGMTWEVYRDSIGQYTWLKDKNGVKIYEGDIYTHNSDLDYRFILYNSWAFCWGVDTGFAPLCWDVGFWSIYSDKFNNEIAVVANTYEHPNLLK